MHIADASVFVKRAGEAKAAKVLRRYYNGTARAGTAPIPGVDREFIDLRQHRLDGKPCVRPCILQQLLYSSFLIVKGERVAICVVCVSPWWTPTSPCRLPPFLRRNRLGRVDKKRANLGEPKPYSRSCISTAPGGGGGGVESSSPSACFLVTCFNVPRATTCVSNARSVFDGSLPIVRASVDNTTADGSVDECRRRYRMRTRGPGDRLTVCPYDNLNKNRVSETARFWYVSSET